MSESRHVTQHHIVKVQGDHSHLRHLASQHGANLVTGTGRHIVAHFDDHKKSTAFHKALKASGHADAKHDTVRSSE